MNKLMILMHSETLLVICGISLFFMVFTCFVILFQAEDVRFTITCTLRNIR